MLPCCRGTNLTLVERKAALSESMKPFGCGSLIIVEALNYDITGVCAGTDELVVLCRMGTRASGVLFENKEQRDSEHCVFPALYWTRAESHCIVSAVVLRSGVL